MCSRGMRHDFGIIQIAGLDETYVLLPTTHNFRPDTEVGGSLLPTKTTTTNRTVSSIASRLELALLLE